MNKDSCFVKPFLLSYFIMMFFLSPLGCNYLELLKQNYILQNLMHWKKNSSCCTLQISLLFKTQRALPSNPPIPLTKMV